MKILLRSVSAVALLALSACATSKPPPVVARVDLNRYQGVWLEAARLPVIFQKGCVDTSAEYWPQSDGRVGVINRCQKNGKAEEVRGHATVVDPATNAKLEVRFDTWFGPFIPRAPQGNYWILSLTKDYSLAAVGTPDRKCLWILARQLPIDSKRYDAIVKYCGELGYPVEKLIVSARQNARHE